MATKTTALIIGAILVAGLGLGRVSNSFQNEKEPQRENTLLATARRTKAEGKSHIAVPGPIIDYPGLNVSIDYLLSHESAVVAEPIASKGYLENENSIGTWYKFRIREAISLRTAEYCITCPDPGSPPPELSSLLPNEFLLAVDGGTVSLEAVEVTQYSDCIPPFKAGKSYLLFISLLPGGVARLGVGPAGIFRVDNDMLEGVDNHKRRAYDELQNRFGRSLSQIKAHISR